MRCLALILFLPLFVIGQSHQQDVIYVDSIYKSLDTIQDQEEHFLAINNAAEQHLRQRPEIGIIIGKRMLEDAEKEKNHRKKTSALYILGRGYFNYNQPLKAEDIYKQSIAYEYSFSKIDTAKLAWVYHNAANYYKKRGRYTKAIELFEKSLNLEEKRGHLENQASCHLNIGAMYLYLGQNKKAISPLTKSKSISFSIGDTATAQSCLNNIAIIYQESGDYTKALKTLDSAALYAKKPYDKAYVYGDYASIYHEMGNIVKAVDYYKKAEKAFDQAGTQLEKARVIMSIAELFHDQSHHKRALQMYQNALEIFKTLENEDFQAQSFLKIGQLYEEISLQDSSLLYYKRAYAIAEKSENILLLGGINLSLGQFFKKTKQLTKAISYLKAALNFFNESGSSDEVTKASIYLAQCYNSKTDKRQAIRYVKEVKKDVGKTTNQPLKEEVLNSLITDFYYAFTPREIKDFHIALTRVRDSLRSEENAKAVAQLSTNYQLKEMVDSIGYTKSLLVKQREINDINSKVSQQQKQLIWIISIGGLLLILLLIILFINRGKIKARNRENKLLLGEIHHRVKNNLQVISSLLSLQEKNLTDQSAKKALKDGKSRVKSIGLIHKLLYQKDEFAGINIKTYTQKLIDTIATTYGYTKSNFDVILELNSLKVDVDKAIPIGLIMNELMNNSFKYAFSTTGNNHITIRFLTDKNYFILEYSDSGEGNKAILEESNSFGYQMILSLTKQLKGEVNVEEKSGLSYHFQIPKDE